MNLEYLPHQARVKYASAEARADEWIEPLMTSDCFPHQVRVQYASAEARADEWIEPRRLKQSRRVAEMAEVTARWLNACTPSQAGTDAPFTPLGTRAVTIDGAATGTVGAVTIDGAATGTVGAVATDGAATGTVGGELKCKIGTDSETVKRAVKCKIGTDSETDVSATVKTPSDSVKRAVKTTVKTKKRVTVNPLPESEEVEEGTTLIREVPEWRSGKRPSPPSASSTNQVDGVHH